MLTIGGENVSDIRVMGGAAGPQVDSGRAANSDGAVVVVESRSFVNDIFLQQRHMSLLLISRRV